MNISSKIFFCWVCSVLLSLRAVSQCGQTGLPLPYKQGFENATNLTGINYSVINPDNNLTWSITNTTAGLGTGTNSLWMNFYNYSIGLGEKDTLIFPMLNFSGVQQPILSFKYAYTRYTGYTTDSLIVLAKAVCDSNWQRIAAFGENGSGAFATMGTGYGISSAFTPQALSDWCGQPGFAACKSISLDAFSGYYGVSIAFVSVNNYSNNLFVDDIEVNGSLLNKIKIDSQNIDLCIGDSIAIPFSVKGYFDTANIFIAQLSDSSGNFNTNDTLGILKSISGGILKVKTPATKTPGKYQLRIFSSAPYTSDTIYNAQVSLKAPAAIVITSPSSANHCAGVRIIFNSKSDNTGIKPQYHWYKNSLAVGIDSSVYFDDAIKNNDTVWCILQSSAPCVTIKTATSNKVVVKVNAGIPQQLPYSQNFEGITNLVSAGYQILNPDNQFAWAVNNSVVNAISGTSSLWLNFYKYNNAIGERDTLIFPPVDLSNTTKPNLSFKHAYTRYAGYSTDSLIILASTGCGDNWVRIKALGENGSGSFATAGSGFATNIEFFPAAVNDWCGQSGFSGCTNINLNSFAGSNGVRLAFVSVNNYSNNLFIDDINITDDSTTIKVDSLKNIQICEGKIFAIPFTVSKNLNAGNTFAAQLSDALGLFNTPVIIGTKTSISGDTIFAIIPTSVPTGNKYRVRVIADNPNIISADNGVDISIVQTIIQNQNLFGCNSVVYNTVTYTSSAVVNDTIRASQGCDSIYNIVNIIVASITPTTQAQNLSDCFSVIYAGHAYTSSIAFADTLRNSFGCDSVYVSVNINIQNAFFSGNMYHPLKGLINFKRPATVMLTGTVNQLLPCSNTYSFNCLPVNSSVVVRCSKNNDSNKNNGVSIIDVVLTQRHLLGLTKFNSPYKIIASDVNGNNGVSNIDIILMRRLILGIDTTFTSSKGEKRLWAFVDSGYVFPDSTNPFPYKDSIGFTNFNSSKINQSFVALKLGDVNYDWDANKPRGIVTDNIQLTYSIDNGQLIMDNGKRNKNNELSIVNSQLSIPVTVSNFKDLLGLQYTLNFDNEQYEFVRIDNNKLGIDFNSAQANATGNISMLWSDGKAQPQTLEDGADLFTLVLRKKELGIRSQASGIRNLELGEIANNHSRFTHDLRSTSDVQLMLSNDITAIEAWDKYDQTHGVIISKKQTPNSTKDKQETGNELTIYPNPSKGEVNISVGNAKELVVTDYLGRTIKQFTNIKSTILHIQLPKGVYMVSAITNDGKKTEKIIIE